MPACAWAVDYYALDLAQERLKLKYDETLATAGTREEIVQALEKQDTQKIASAIPAIEKFFASYDQFSMAKIDLFMIYALQETTARYQTIRPHLRNLKTRKLDKKFNKIELLYKEYQTVRHDFGKEKDFLRIEAGRDFFNHAALFAQDLRKELGENPTRIWGVKLLPFIDNLKEMAPLTDDLLLLLYSSYFHARRNKENEAPIIDALRKISAEIAKQRKTETKWFGLENIKEMPLDGESINIFVFMHANSYYDTAVQGTLELDGLSSIGNVDIIFPPFIAKRMIKSDHIVTVGHGDILAKTEGIIRSKRLNKFFIAAEGLTPIGFYEMRPLIDVFANSVYALMERGLKVNLYPISFPDNFRFMNDFRNPIEGNKLAYGIIHPKIETQELNSLMKITKNPQAISQLIRWIWFGDLKNDQTHDLGMPKPTQMREWFDGMFWGNL